MGNDFLYDPKSTGKERKNRLTGYVKVKNFYTAKKTINRVNK
jgi:hypothetical protein